MNRFEDLQNFITVVDAGSFTAAAERLGAAKSAVSRRVAALEKRLGVQLLHRTTRRLDLTDTGRSFYERSVRILADLDEAESAVAQQHGDLRGRLRVALPTSFGISHMAQPIAEFSRQHPLVTFELDLNDRRVDLLQEGVDIALRIGRLSDSSLIAKKLFEVCTVVCASPAYLAAHGTPQTPAELAEHQCLGYSNLADPSRWVCNSSDGERIETEVALALSASSGDFLHAAAIEGMGIALQPTFIAGRAITRGELVPILANYVWPVTPAYAVYPHTRHLSYRVRAFIDFLAAYFAGPLPWDSDCPAARFATTA